MNGLLGNKKGDEARPVMPQGFDDRLDVLVEGYDECLDHLFCASFPAAKFFTGSVSQPCCSRKSKRLPGMPVPPRR
jgi:hypothetical protein